MTWPRHPQPAWFPPVGHERAAALAAVTRPLRVVIADDHAPVRAALRLLLEAQPGLQVVGEAADGVEAIERVHELHPDVVVMDVSMPNMDGIEATRRLHETEPEVHVIGWTMHAPNGAEPAIVAAGATACYAKGSGTRELVHHLLDLQLLRQAASAAGELAGPDARG